MNDKERHSSRMGDDVRRPEERRCAAKKDCCHACREPCSTLGNERSCIHCRRSHSRCQERFGTAAHELRWKGQCE